MGFEVSTFLRCYVYNEGEFSTPHYDRSQCEHQKETILEEDKSLGPVSHVKAGTLVRFSAYSILLYLNDDFEGGKI